MEPVDLLKPRIAALTRAFALFLVIGIIAPAFADSLLILKDDFESYTNSRALNAFWTGGTAELEVTPPGGGQAASHNGGDMNRHAGFTIGPDGEHNVSLSADFYDFATNSDKRVTVSLRRTTGESFDMGLLGSSFYVARVMGFAARTNWVALKRGQVPVAGWHRFRAVLSLTNAVVTLDLNADGIVDGTIDIPFTETPGQFTQIRFGGLSGRPSRGGPVLVDNLRLEVISLAPVLASQSAQQPVGGSPIAPQPQSADYPAVAWWILGALAVIISLLAGLLWIIRNSWPARSHRQAALNAGPESEASLPVPAAAGDVESWRQRATTAEAIAARQAQVLNEKVGPELTEFAKQALVQGLYSQRNALIETQRKAQQALAELEQRLLELQLPAPERILAYEKRIAELEKELETRGTEMRELTHATLLLVRQKLEQEREKDGPRFN